MSIFRTTSFTFKPTQSEGSSLFLLVSGICAPSVSRCDYAQPWQIGFQDPATPIMEGIVDLHHDIMFFLTIIAIFVSYLLMRVCFVFHKDRNNFSKIVHGKVIEIVWTILPSFVLAIIAVPSFALLYSMDEVIDPAITIKVIGHQWYWSYEYSDYVTGQGQDSIAFDSYMVAQDDLELGQLRLLQVDNPIYIPVNTHVRLLITSEDVLHCWTVPSFGVKVDACPGRLNQTSMFVQREGTYYGQCSEICGVNHGFMPICVKAVPLDNYVAWVSSQFDELVVPIHRGPLPSGPQAPVEESKAHISRSRGGRGGGVSIEIKIDGWIT